MSRIGILPIDIPAGVTIEVGEDNLVTVKGPKGELKQQVDKNITVKVEENQLVVSRSSEEKEQKSKHGLYRSLLNNMVVGVSEGYTIQQELVGVGYRAEVKEGKGWSSVWVIPMTSLLRCRTRSRWKPKPNAARIPSSP
jgi:large subunit ribosomal protein L6